MSNQRRRMESIPGAVLVPCAKPKDEDQPAKVVKMVRTRDLLLGGLAWSAITVVFWAIGMSPETKPWDVLSPLVFAIGFAMIVDHHDVNL